MTITTIVIDSINYTSYASLVQADAYLAVDPVRKATWEALTDDQKGQNLVAATRRLDLLTWQGTKTGGSSQANKWPRTGLSFPDGTAVSTTEVPQEVEDSTILLAGSVAITAAAADSGTSSKGIKTLKAGSVNLTFFNARGVKPLQDETAYQLVLLFLETAVAGGDVGPQASGTDGESSFDDLDEFGLSRGFP